nr:site-specific integrase [Rhodococcus sp. 114MFTsu3.1]
MERRTPAGMGDDQHGKQAEDALLDSLAARHAPSEEEITGDTLVSALCVTYLQRLEDEGRSAATLDTYRFAMAKLNTWTAGLRVQEAKPGRMDTVLRSMSKTHGATMARQAKTVLRGALGMAVLADAVPTNPLRDVRPIKGKVGPTGAKAISADELRKLFTDLSRSEYCRQHDLVDPVTMLIATGLRRSELLGLLVSEFDGSTIKVTGKVVRVKGSGLVRVPATKTAAGARTIPLPNFAIDMLERRAGEAHPTNDGVIFPSTAGTLRDPNNFGREWRKARDLLDVPDTTTHSFRKALATLIDDERLPARMGADHLGHRNVSMTQDRYMARGRIHTEVADLLERTVISGE